MAKTSKPPTRASGYRVRMVPVDEVRPYPNNPRKPRKAIEKVAASLDEYGWQQPIVVDADYVVVVGHTRLAAAKSLGMKKVPVHVAENLTDRQAAAYRIADNRTGAEAAWDEDRLIAEMAVFEPEDLGALGFSERELEKLLVIEKKQKASSKASGPILPAGLEYRIVIDCKDETDQRDLIERFDKEGLSCRALIS